MERCHRPALLPRPRRPARAPACLALPACPPTELGLLVLNPSLTPPHRRLLSLSLRLSFSLSFSQSVSLSVFVSLFLTIPAVLGGHCGMPEDIFFHFVNSVHKMPLVPKYKSFHFPDSHNAMVIYPCNCPMGLLVAEGTHKCCLAPILEKNKKQDK